MNTKYRKRAVRLLAEDAGLSASAGRLVIALMEATPVAPRGYATMVPMRELLAILRADATDRAWLDATGREVLATLDEVETAYWSLPFLQEPAMGSFVVGHALSARTGLLHFQVDQDFTAAIAHVSQQLQMNANEPPETKC